MPGLSPLSFGSPELKALKHNWGLFLAYGIALVVLGMLAISMPFIAGLSVALVLGVLLLIGGVIQIIGAFGTRGWGAFGLQLLVGVMYLVVGMVMVEQPVAALIVLTVLVAVSLLVSGLFRIIASVTHQFTGWGWVLLGGVLQVVLGLIIWRQFPESVLWVIGLFVGIDMIYSGVTWAALAMTIRDVSAPTSPSHPATTSNP